MGNGLCFPPHPGTCPGVARGGGQTAVIWEGSGAVGVPVPHVSAGHASLGVTLLPAPKSHLCPEPARPPGQGTPRQRLPPAAAGAQGQVGRGWGCLRARPALGRGAPGASAHPSPRRTGASGPRRSLSVEDIGTPDLPRTVGRVVEVFPDGTSQLELQRPPHGSFGFRLTSGHGRPDTGTVGLSKVVQKSRFLGVFFFG